MPFEFSIKAKEDLLTIEDYLISKWNFEVLEKFLEKLEISIDLLMEKNVFFEKYESTQFYKFLLNKHKTIIYDYDGDLLKIHRILQNFQDPDENKKSITK